MYNISINILLAINFFILSIALLGVYYYAYRLKMEFKRSDLLRKESEKFQKLFNSTSDGVFQTDRDGRFVLINQSGADIMGFKSPQEVIENNIGASEFYEDPKELDALRKMIIENGAVNKYIFKGKKQDGKTYFSETSIHFLRNEINGEFIGFEGIFREVTERIRLQEELKQYSDNLEQLVQRKTQRILSLEKKKIHLESLASLGEMVATIVHEIRNPLSSIKMGLSTVLKRTTMETREREFLVLANLEVTFLERYLQDLLNFAKPLTIKSVDQDINLIFDMALAQLHDEFSIEGITIKKDFAADLPQLQLDAGRIQQVFFNLFLNAKEAISNGGTIHVNIKNMRKENKVRIEVIDDGEGIQPESLHKIFNPFFSSKENGTGLGLTVVQKVIEAHGGELGIESELGKGTTVWMELPVNSS